MGIPVFCSMSCFYMAFFFPAKCIDRYTDLKVKKFDGSLEEGHEIDPRLEDIVDRMFVRCLADKRYNQAVGIAFETRRIDILEQVIRRAVSIAHAIFLAAKCTLNKALILIHVYSLCVFPGRC